MKKLSLKIIAATIDGAIVQGSAGLPITNVVVKPRRITPNALLFDIRRRKQDHSIDYHRNFPYALVTSRAHDFYGLGDNVTLVRVAKVSEAYWKFINFYRNLFAIPVIGVTGTCGKTTTKEMVKQILAGTYQTNATYKSYNALFRNLNYLLEINDQTQAAVYEMGVAYPGDLKTASRYFQPQVGIITNIGIDHLQAFGSLEAYIKAKAELLEGLGPQGTVVLNGDDPNIRTIDLSNFKGKVCYFGFGEQCQLQIVNVRHGNANISCDLQYDGRPYRLVIPGHAEFNVYNAAAAIGATQAVGIKVADACARLSTFQNVEKHFEFNPGINGSTIIDDTWSTNPTSIEAALKLLKSFSQGKKSIAVLGKVSLLGSQSNHYHYQIGARCAALELDQLIVIGDGADLIGHGALQNGMPPDRVAFCRDSDATYELLKNWLDPETIALVKTSMLTSYSNLMAKLIVRNSDKKS